MKLPAMFTDAILSHDLEEKTFSVYEGARSTSLFNNEDNKKFFSS